MLLRWRILFLLLFILGLPLFVLGLVRTKMFKRLDKSIAECLVWRHISVHRKHSDCRSWTRRNLALSHIIQSLVRERVLVMQCIEQLLTISLPVDSII